MYGVDLTTVVKMCNTKVPVIVTNCIQEIENRGMSYTDWVCLTETRVCLTETRECLTDTRECLTD